MRMVLHAGVKCSNEERLLQSLRSNKGILRQRQVSVPDPRNYRVILREKLNKLRQQEASEDARDVLVEFFLEGEPEDTNSIVLSNAFFFGTPRVAINDNRFYPKAVTNVVKFLHFRKTMRCCVLRSTIR